MVAILFPVIVELHDHLTRGGNNSNSQVFEL